MYKLQSGDSIFIFSFDDKLFESVEECLNYEFETLKPGSLIRCVFEPKNREDKEVLEIYRLTYKKTYRIRRLYISPLGEKKFIFEADGGLIQDLILERALGTYFNVISEQEQIVS